MLDSLDNFYSDMSCLVDFKQIDERDISFFIKKMHWVDGKLKEIKVTQGHSQFIVEHRHRDEDMDPYQATVTPKSAITTHCTRPLF